MILEIICVLGIILANVICCACNERSILEKWTRLPTILAISNRSAQFLSKKPTQYWAFDVLDPNHLVASDFLNDVGVLLLRAGTFAFFVSTLVIEGLTDDGFGGSFLGWFTWFTNWTFVVYGIWALLGTGITAWYIQARLTNFSKRSSEEGQQLNSVESQSTEQEKPLLKWNTWTVAFVVLTELVATSTLFLSVFFWVFLYNPKYPLPVDGLLKHGINNLVLLGEIILCRVPFVSYHYQVVLFYGTLYTVFMWIYHAASLHWMYSVLDWSKPLSVGLYLLNPILLFLAYCIWHCIAYGRERLGVKLTKRNVTTALQQVDLP